jgi:hypothetical protein
MLIGGSSGSGGQKQSMLSLIAEFPGNEDVSPSCPSIPPLSHNNSQPELSSFHSTGLSSDDLDDPGARGQNSMAISDSAQAKMSLKEQPTDNPKQMKYKLKSVSLCI